MRKRNIIIVAIILMAIGFATLTTNLIINGNTTVSNNKEDYDIRFTKTILEGTENNSLISNDGKEINYETKQLTNVGDKSELVYEISNNSSQYDAEVSISCVPTGTITHTSYYTINTSNTPEIVKAKRSARGSIEITLTKLSTESIKENFKCTLNINAMERTSIGESCPYESGNEWTFDYKGSEDEFIVPCGGEYKLEVWGAQGGTANASFVGGYGGYSVSEISLKKEEQLFINVGGQGWNDVNNFVAGGYNGGGDGQSASPAAFFASGGGATHIAIKSGLLSTLEKDKESVLIVAGGGGGSWYQTQYYRILQNGGSGGGYIGNSANGEIATSANTTATGGQQTIGGKLGNYNYSVNKVSGSFGQGGHRGSNCGSGGGGGYYGGGAALCTAGGGGSGYIANPKTKNKAMYCYNCLESNDEEIKTVSTINVSRTPVSGYAKIGYGYVKITYIGSGI